jgi:putative methylase
MSTGRWRSDVPGTRRRLAQELGVVAGFEEPDPRLEQYHTPADIAAHLVHVADLQGGVEDRTVLDLGSGTGMLALGAALRGPRRVVGVELDADALATARENERRVGTTADVEWVRGDVTDPPLRRRDDTTVLMNPPFGAQRGNEHADREFLRTAADLGEVSYSIHNTGSREFVESFATDHGGTVTHAYEAEFDLPHQFEFHDRERRSLGAEVFRIEWAGSDAD